MSPQPRNHRFELETLSPVRVGAGQDAVLSPYTDFVQDGGHLIYLDPRKLERALTAQSEGVMDEFARGVRSRMNNTRSDFELADFIRTRLGTTPDALARRRVPVRGAVKHAQVRRHISNGGQPYIPGSSLKGAIRGAILYCWLVDAQEGRRFVADLADVVERLWNVYGRQLEEAERHYREGNIRNGDRLAGAIPHKVKPELRPFSDERLFGGLKDRGHGPEMRFLRLGDTVPLAADIVRVAEVNRVKLFNAQMVAPQWSEVLPRGVRTTFTLSVEPRFTRPDLQFLNGSTLEPLLERLNRFAADSLEWEIGVLDSLSEVDALNDVYNAVLDVDEPEPLARLGSAADRRREDVLRQLARTRAARARPGRVRALPKAPRPRAQPEVQTLLPRTVPGDTLLRRRSRATCGSARVGAPDSGPGDLVIRRTRGDTRSRSCRYAVEGAEYLLSAPPGSGGGEQIGILAEATSQPHASSTSGAEMPAGRELGSGEGGGPGRDAPRACELPDTHPPTAGWEITARHRERPAPPSEPGLRVPSGTPGTKRS